MWWGGFLLCGLLLILTAIPFFSFPKTLQREKEKIRILEKSKPAPAKEKDPTKEVKKAIESDDTGYGKDIKGKLYKIKLICIPKLGLVFQDVSIKID